jgi:hypothetical protein
MPKALWRDLEALLSTDRILIAVLAPELRSGSAYAGPEIREVSEAVLRACRRLGLEGHYASTPLRRDGRPEVLIGFEHRDDLATFAGRLKVDLTMGQGPWRFTLDDRAWAGLVKLAGPPKAKRKAPGQALET